MSFPSAALRGVKVFATNSFDNLLPVTKPGNSFGLGPLFDLLVVRLDSWEREGGEPLPLPGW